MNKFVKFVGLTALAAAVLPYRIGSDKDSGEIQAQGLFWSLRYSPNAQPENEGEKGRHGIDLTVGPTFSLKKKEAEAHVYSDDIVIAYHPQEDEAAQDPDGENAAAGAEQPKEPAAAEAPAPEKHADPGPDVDMATEAIRKALEGGAQ